MSPAPPPNPSDTQLAKSLARLWPNREHESTAPASLLCRLGLHNWRQLDLTNLAPNRTIHFCFWCSNIKIDGTLYKP